MAGIAREQAARAVDQRLTGKFDPWLVVSTIILMTVGYMSLYSEGISRDGGSDFRKQVVFGVIGLVPLLLFATVHPKIWQRLAGVLYGLNIAGLLAIFVIGSKKKGADRWIEIGSFQFQPSEMAKLLTIITLAAF